MKTHFKMTNQPAVITKDFIYLIAKLILINVVVCFVSFLTFHTEGYEGTYVNVSNENAHMSELTSNNSFVPERAIYNYIDTRIFAMGKGVIKKVQ